jgi:hypothetical protein
MHKAVKLESTTQLHIMHISNFKCFTLAVTGTITSLPMDHFSSFFFYVLLFFFLKIM